MSGLESGATMEPSMYSTIEWTTDWGVTTADIFEAGWLKRNDPSITSSPLFISVAESIDIFLPIFHLGWARACSGVTDERLPAGEFKSGPPEAVRIKRLMSRALWPLIAG